MTDNLFCTNPFDFPAKPTEFIIVNNGDTTNYSLANGVLSIDNNAYKSFKISWPFIDRIDGVKVFCPVNAVAQIDTITTTVLPQVYTDRPSIEYTFNVEWKDTNGVLQSKTYRHTFLTTTTWTETLVTDQFVIEVNNDDNAIVTASNNGGHIRLTSDTAGQGFSTKVSASWMTVTHTTPNTIDFGSGDKLADKYSFTTTDNILDDATVDYAIVEIPYFMVTEGDLSSFNAMSQNRVFDKHVLWIIVEVGGAAEDAVLGATQGAGLCKILTGVETAAKYLQVVAAGCPCS